MPYLNASQPFEANSYLSNINCNIYSGKIISPSNKVLLAGLNSSQELAIQFNVNMPTSKALIRGLSTFGVLNFSSELPVGTVVNSFLTSPDDNSYSYAFTYTVKDNPKSQFDLSREIERAALSLGASNTNLSFTIFYPENCPLSPKTVTATLQLGGTYNGIHRCIASKSIDYSVINPVDPTVPTSDFIFNKTSDSADYKDIVVMKNDGTYVFDSLYYNGNKLDTANIYYANNNKVYMKKEYLQTLSNGEHTFSLKYKNTEFSPTFTINVQENPTIGTLGTQTVNALSAFSGLTTPDVALNDSSLLSCGWEYTHDKDNEPWSACNDSDIIEHSLDDGFLRYYVETEAGRTVSNDATLCVNRLPLTVTVNDIEIDRGQSVPTPIVSVTGFLNDVVPSGFIKPTAEISESIDTKDCSINTYNITVTDGDATDNYEFKPFPTTANIKINKINVTDDDWYSDKELNKWQNDDVVLTPKNGFTKISTDGITWLDTLTLSNEGKNDISFCLKSLMVLLRK